MQNCDPQNKRLIAAAVIEKDGKVLIAQRAKRDAFFGKWEFPGGKVEEGETLHECLKREIREELNIDVEVGEYICSTSFSTRKYMFEMSVFRVKKYHGDIQLKEHSAIEWLSPQELYLYDFTKPDYSIIEALQEKK